MRMLQPSIRIPSLLAILTAGCATGIARDNQPVEPPAISVVTESIAPVHVTRRDDGVFFLDFGRDAFAQLELTLPDHAGTTIKVGMGEKLSDASHMNSKPGGSVRFFETNLTTEAGKTHYRVELTKKDARLMPPDIGPVMPFRYVELSNMPPGTTVDSLTHDIRQIAVHYPFDDNAADFACSDEKLNQIWKLCKYSIKATSYGGIFVDGDRERKPYEADAFINSLGWYCCTSDTTLPAHSNQYLINHPTWPTEWIMFSVLCAWNDYLYTGDVERLKSSYSDLKAKTLQSLEREDGLISTVNPAVPDEVSQSIHFKGKLKDIVDWPGKERDDYEMKPVNTVVNAFHC